MKLSIIIPAYNEEKRIPETLRQIDKYMQAYQDYEIIVVDDGSQDKTTDVVNELNYKNVRVLTNETNSGKGYSVRVGVEAARGDLILFSDADLSTPIEELPKFLDAAKTFDVVIASRNLKESVIPVKQPWFRSLLGKMFPLLVRLIVLPGIKDTQCGFKLFKASVAKKIFAKQTLNGFAFDVEVLYIALKQGYNIKELPVTWRNALGSKVSLLKDTFRMFFDLIKIRINDMKGMY